MLKMLRAGLKGLFRPAPGAAQPAGAARRGAETSAWFEQTRSRIAARDAAVADAIREALERAPQNAEAHALAGELQLASGAPAAALPHLARALELKPEFAHAHNARGEALRALGRQEDALACFQRAVEAAHDLAPAHCNMGEIYEALGQDEEAADCFNLALAFDESAVGAGLGLGRLLRKQGRLPESVSQLRRTLEHAPDCAPAHFELARSLNQAGDTAGAVAAYERALAADPAYAEAWSNLGLVQLSQLGDALRAESMFRRAAELNPDLLEAQANLGLALQEQGRFGEALQHYEVQIARWPGFVEFRWNRGIANLALGRFAAGWDDYELRKLRPDAGGVHQKFTLPEWDGTSLAGRSILVYGEQGLGDEIMFASCLPEVTAPAGSCVVECDARLAALYRRSFPQARIEARERERARDWHALYPALELQSAIGSLPRFLRKAAADFPDRAGYLVADPAATARWRERLGARGPSVRVGISWRGGTAKTRVALRSVALGELAPLLDGGDARFVSLQRDVTADERAVFGARSNVVLADPPADVEELAALVGALDLVVSVDNTNVHLAGALGRPVWVLLSPGNDWRYGAEGESMPWYPSAKLFRRERGQGWDAVTGRLARELKRFCAEPRTGPARCR